MELVSFLIIALVIATVIKLSVRPKDFPPGPWGLPLVGNITVLLTNKPINKILQSLAKSYGPVTGVYLGPQPIISVSGQEAIKEALLNDDLLNRPSGAVLRNRTFGEKLGLIFVDGPFWQEQRRFTLRHLRDLGFGKTSIEDQMMDEIHDLINDIKELAQSNVDRVVEFNAMFGVSVINILWAIIGGKRFQRGDAAFKNLVLDVDRFAKSANIGLILFPVPDFLVRNVPLIPRLMGTGNDLFDPLQKFINDNIDEHLATRSEGDAPRDFIDVYLNEMDKRGGHGETTATSTRKKLVAIVQDLFTAGSETSSNTIGNLHLHSASKDTTIRGFQIPKGSLLVMNYESVFRDKAIWKDPENFRPERHLDINGRVVKNEALTPFGMGKRACLGEPLARNTVFLFVTALAKTFEFKTVPGEAHPSLEPITGLTTSPRPFRASVVPRHTLHTA